MKHILSFLLLFPLFTSYSQSTLESTLLDQNGEPLSYATVTINDQVDSSLVKAEYTDLNGNFSIQGLEKGSYLLQVTYVGYIAYTTIINIGENQSVTLDPIVLTEDAEELEEVTVRAKKPLVELLPDKTVFNVEGSINASGDNAFELLRKSPGVLIDDSDNILLNGKRGIRIHIDGKESPLIGEELANFLKTIQSSEVSAIELITNPSARYDAEGNAGIINIRLKRNKSYGTNGTVSAGFSQGITPKGEGSLNLNHRQQFFNAYGSYGYSTGYNHHYMDLYREQTSFILINDVNGYSDRQSQNIKAGVDLYISPKSILGIEGNVWLSETEGFNTTETRIADSDGAVDSILISENNTDDNSDNYLVKATYRYEDEDGLALGADVDYGRYQKEGYTSQPNIYYTPDLQQIINERRFAYSAPSDISIYTGKIDLEKSLGKGVISGGAKVSFVTSENTYHFYDVVDGMDIIDPERSNFFEYTENVNAAYISYNRKGEKWGYYAGLRIENTHSIGTLESLQNIEEEHVERDYTDFFPSAGINHSLNKGHQLRLNYSRRIDRPRYQQLNPFEYKLDELTFRKGNAFLNPQYTHSIELGHTYKYKFNTSVSYSITDDYFTQITDTIGEKGGFITIANLAQQRIWNLNFSAPVSFNKWWNFYGNTNLIHLQNEADFGDETREIDIEVTFLSLFIQNTFLLPKGFSAELSGQVNSPGVWGGNFKTGWFGGVDVGLQKKLWDNKATVRLKLSDIFKTRAWEGERNFTGTYERANGGWESRIFSVNFIYAFGSADLKSRKTKNDLDEEHRRARGENGGGGIGG